MADDRLTGGGGLGTGETPPTVVNFGRARSALHSSPGDRPTGDRPTGERAAGEQAAGDTPTGGGAVQNGPMDDPTPRRAPPSGLIIAGLGVSLVWLVTLVAGAFLAGEAGRAALIDGVIAAAPLGLIGLIAAVVTPLVVLWLVVAVFDRNASIHREAVALREQLALLTYPASAAESRIATVADSLRAQTASLATATREAATQGQELRQVLARETADLARVGEDARTTVADALARINARTETLHGLMKDVGRLASEADETLTRRSDSLSRAADRAKENADTLGSVLSQHNQNLNAVSGTLAERTKAVEGLTARQEAAAESMRVAALALGEATDRKSVV